MYQLKQIPTNSQIKKYLRSIVFGKNIFCPVCHKRGVQARQDRYWCGKCRIRFSLLSHTWLSDSKIPLQKMWLILWCWTHQVPVKQTEALAELSEKGVRHWFDTFRSHLPRNQKLLEAIVQLDEAYFGGWTGFALLMGKQKGTRNLAYQVIPADSVTKEDAVHFLEQYVKPHSLLCTDGGKMYRNIDKWYPVQHSVDIHKQFEFTHTSEIEGMFGVIRTFIRRMYHHVTPEKFPDYMLEFYWRFSQKELFESPYQYLLKTLSLAPTG